MLRLVGALLAVFKLCCYLVLLEAICRVSFAYWTHSHKMRHVTSSVSQRFPQRVARFVDPENKMWLLEAPSKCF